MYKKNTVNTSETEIHAFVLSGKPKSLNVWGEKKQGSIKITPLVPTYTVLLHGLDVCHVPSCAHSGL